MMSITEDCKLSPSIGGCGWAHKGTLAKRRSNKREKEKDLAIFNSLVMDAQMYYPAFWFLSFRDTTFR
ncbi:MAG TPA: hypothetical protein VFD56_00700 [Chitinophagaceae bacterium]|nr:hypothetical protein [Chitinophagaceae bacterium]